MSERQRLGTWDLPNIPDSSPVEDELAAYESVVTRLESVAKGRGEAAHETLSKALDALEGLASAQIRPAGKTVPLFADGMPACACDGEETAGPHHKPGCARRTAA